MSMIRSAIFALMLAASLFAQSRPVGVLEPPPAFSKAQTEIENENFDQALALLKVDLPSGWDHIWHDYLEGLARIGKKDYDAATEVLELCKAQLDGLGGDVSAKRMLSRVERKLGLIERERKNFDLASQLHRNALALAVDYGSAEEEHDCWISLDVDAWHNQDWKQSEEVLRASLDVAEQIQDETAKLRARATSLNNLGGTLAQLNRFQEGDDALNQSLTLWSDWEQLSGKSNEHRAIWAHYGIADLHLLWAKSIGEADHLQASQHKARAKYELMVAVAMGREANMSTEDLHTIEKRYPECD